MKLTIAAEILHATYDVEPPDDYGSPEVYDIHTVEYGGVDITPVLSEMPGAVDVVEKSIRRAEHEAWLNRDSEG